MDIAHSSTAVTSSRISSFSCHLTKCPHSFMEQAGQFLLLCLECLPAGHLSCSVEGLCVWEWLRSAERLWQCTGEAGLLPLLIHCYSYKLQKLSLGTIITIQFQGISHTSLSPWGHFEFQVTGCLFSFLDIAYGWDLMTCTLTSACFQSSQCVVLIVSMLLWPTSKMPARNYLEREGVTVVHRNWRFSICLVP